MVKARWAHGCAVEPLGIFGAWMRLLIIKSNFAGGKGDSRNRWVRGENAVVFPSWPGVGWKLTTLIQTGFGHFYCLLNVHNMRLNQSEYLAYCKSPSKL
jgi:hypothetical protein